MSLADILNKIDDKKEELVAKDGVLTSRLRSFLSSRSNDRENPDAWHPSSLYQMCCRQEWFKRMIPKQEPPHKAELQIVFDVGHAMHDWIRSRWFSDMDILVGMWKCSICGNISWGKKPKEPCSKYSICSDRSHWNFSEAKFQDSDDLGIVGRPDGFLDLGDTKGLLEIKTINHEGYEALYEALPHHVYQAQIYANLKPIFPMGNLDYSDYNKRIFFLYFDKGSPIWKFPMKEFVVDRSEDAYQDARKNIQIVQAAIKEQKNTAVVNKEKCKYCLYKKECKVCRA